MAMFCNGGRIVRTVIARVVGGSHRMDRTGGGNGQVGATNRMGKTDEKVRQRKKHQ